MKNYVWLNIIFYILLILCNYLANAIPFGGNTTGEVSSLYDNLFVPAGYTFAIWGLIYLSLGIFVVRAALGNNLLIRQVSQKTGPWLSLNFLANIIWLWVWHNEMPGVSWIIMTLILWSLVKIYLLTDDPATSIRSVKWWSAQFAFSLYLGWICVAYIANGAAFFTATGVEFGMEAAYITSFMLLAATCIGLFFIWKFKDPVPALVIIWALGGIYAKYQLRDNVAELPLTLITVFTLLLAVNIIWIVLFSPNRSLQYS